MISFRFEKKKKNHCSCYVEEELLLGKNGNRAVKKLFSKTRRNGHGLFLGDRSGDDKEQKTQEALKREGKDVTSYVALGAALRERVWGYQNYLFNPCLLPLTCLSVHFMKYSSSSTSSH